MNLSEWRERRRQNKQQEAVRRGEWIWERIAPGAPDETLVFSNKATPGVTLAISYVTYMGYSEVVGLTHLGVSMYRTMVALHRIFRGTEVMFSQPYIDNRNVIWWKTRIGEHTFYVTGNDRFNLETSVNNHKVFIEGPIGWAKFVTAVLNRDEKQLARTTFQ